jgi:hypothetical protein
MWQRQIFKTLCNVWQKPNFRLWRYILHNDQICRSFFGRMSLIFTRTQYSKTLQKEKWKKWPKYLLFHSWQIHQNWWLWVFSDPDCESTARVRNLQGKDDWWIDKYESYFVREPWILVYSSFSYPYPTEWCRYNMFFIMLIKIRQLYLRPVTCLTWALLETEVGANDCKCRRDQRLNVPSKARRSSR